MVAGYSCGSRDEAALAGSLECGGADQRAVGETRGLVQDASPRVDHLGDLPMRPDDAVESSLRQAAVRLLGKRRDGRGLRAEGPIERAVEIGGNALMHVEPGGHQHDRHDASEGKS